MTQSRSVPSKRYATCEGAPTAPGGDELSYGAAGITTPCNTFARSYGLKVTSSGRNPPSVIAIGVLVGLATIVLVTTAVGTMVGLAGTSDGVPVAAAVVEDSGVALGSTVAAVALGVTVPV